jgi:protein-tyrosine phosphatase
MNDIKANEIFTSATQIVPGLWLGNQAASQNLNFLENVDVIINCTKHIPFATTDKLRIRLAVNDPGPPLPNVSYDDDVNRMDPNDDQVIMIKALPSLLRIIAALRRKQKRILVHCHAGAQRSAALLAAYLTVYAHWEPPTGYSLYQLRRMKFATVVRMIVKKRPVAFAGGRSVNFQPALTRHLNLSSSLTT